ncbi:MATE family efflux transporter, partial [bacterium]|nr:MATE family efflux transporter [bacterium]
LLILLLFGVSSGISVFTAQYWGKKDIVNIKKMVGIGLIAGFTGATIFAVCAFFAPRFIMSIYSKDQQVIITGIQYLRITSFSYFFSAITIIFSVVLRSMHQVKMPLLISTFALLTNSFLNYLLIFGKLGFPQLGVRGAAIATLCSRSLEVIFLISVLYATRNPIAGTLREFTDFSKTMVKKAFATAAPVVINEFGWGLGTVFFCVIYARMSTDAVASYNISDQAMNLSMVVIFGTCTACSTLIGNSIGAKDEEQAILNGKRFLFIGLITGIISGVVIILLSPFIPMLFNVPLSIKASSRNLLFFFGLIVTFKSLNFHLIVGILRGGGDTRFGMILDIGAMWGIGIPLACIGAFYWNLPVHFVYLLACTEEIIKIFFGLHRFRSRKWITDLVN